MEKKVRTFSGDRPVFTGSPSLEVAGFNLDTTNQSFVDGDIIPAGALLNVNESTRKCKVIKTAKVTAVDNVAVTLASDDHLVPIFAVGDHVNKVTGGTYSSGITIAAIAKTDSSYVVTLSGAITGLAAGDILFSVVEENSKEALLTPNAMNVEDTEVTDQEIVLGATKDTMQFAAFERRIPPIPESLKTGDYVSNTNIRLTQMV